MDISMPVWDGYKTLEMVKKKWPKIKTLVLTMHKHEMAVIKMFSHRRLRLPAEKLPPGRPACRAGCYSQHRLLLLRAGLPEHFSPPAKLVGDAHTIRKRTATAEVLPHRHEL